MCRASDSASRRMTVTVAESARLDWRWQRQRRLVSSRRRWRAHVVMSMAWRRDTPHQTTDLKDVAGG